MNGIARGPLSDGSWRQTIAFCATFFSVAMFIALVAAILLCGVLVAFSHEHWIQDGKYRSIGPFAYGQSCCSEEDCKEVPFDQVSIDANGYVLFGKEHIPRWMVQPSEDDKYWRCRTANNEPRCFFAPRPRIM